MRSSEDIFLRIPNQRYHPGFPDDIEEFWPSNFVSLMNRKVYRHLKEINPNLLVNQLELNTLGSWG
jgi:hypothetical protein